MAGSQTGWPHLVRLALDDRVPISLVLRRSDTHRSKQHRSAATRSLQHQACQRLSETCKRGGVSAFALQQSSGMTWRDNARGLFSFPTDHIDLWITPPASRRTVTIRSREKHFRRVGSPVFFCRLGPSLENRRRHQPEIGLVSWTAYQAAASARASVQMCQPGIPPFFSPPWFCAKRGPGAKGGGAGSVKNLVRKINLSLSSDLVAATMRLKEAFRLRPSTT